MLKGGGAGLTAKVCTWSSRDSPLDGCENIEEGMPALDGIGLPEWSVFPLVLRGETPLWGDLFVACEGARARGATLRLPDLRVKWDAVVEIVVDAPATRWGQMPNQTLAEEVVQEAATKLCSGRLPIRE